MYKIETEIGFVMKKTKREVQDFLKFIKQKFPNSEIKVTKEG